MHIVTHLSEKYEKLRTPENGWSIQEAGMAQLDDIVGAVMKKLKDVGLEDDTIVVFTTDNGAENFTWPDGGQTPFAGGKGTVMEGGFRVPCIVRWPGKVPAGKVENGLISGLDWFPTFVAAAGNPDIVEELKKGKTLGDRTYKVHLDGYNQLDLITGKGPSKRNEIFYFAESTLGAVRIGDYKYRFIDQPNGWLGGTVKPTGRSSPISAWIRSSATGMTGSLNFYNWFAYEFWRFVFVQQEVAKFGETFIEFPPMQKGASFNLEAVKQQILEAAKAHKASEPSWPLKSRRGARMKTRTFFVVTAVVEAGAGLGLAARRRRPWRPCSARPSPRPRGSPLGGSPVRPCSPSAPPAGCRETTWRAVPRPGWSGLCCCTTAPRPLSSPMPAWSRGYSGPPSGRD